MYLQQYIHLNVRDAKKIESKRGLKPFTSLKDIEDIAGLAQTSLKKIKDYITCQQYKKEEITTILSARFNGYGSVRFVFDEFPEWV